MPHVPIQIPPVLPPRTPAGDSRGQRSAESGVVSPLPGRGDSISDLESNEVSRHDAAGDGSDLPVL